MRFWPFSKREKQCRHEFDYMKDMTPRDVHGQISCRCHKCSQVFRAECGLDLPGKLVQLRDAP